MTCGYEPVFQSGHLAFFFLLSKSDHYSAVIDEVALGRHSKLKATSDFNYDGIHRTLLSSTFNCDINYEYE